VGGAKMFEIDVEAVRDYQPSAKTGP